ncbi:hypothetical protein TPHA_0F00490 [Tetrapisispora phaffii CBS 4417]|uniref:tRNA-binding domain-containing protein n=1 Tax=Tetrapisispora phaffii (strain ATCC 24235 / CBS 4417 / NBRC 1672 / NRRL Y-8282 / UCD 70-5) TaxID=1071381 RepID=G8BUV4_TETPH|nr:hypothetical protein TPHA_0F00490 [Tetrapisispora phaffii CBS 4417]CCE63536.1 hypothetical protein TPHA_0F00490 [Tetrapisispora phaffii CBS 4417]
MIRLNRYYVQNGNIARSIIPFRRCYHFNLLNLKIGYTNSVALHPNSEKLYISQIQVSKNASDNQGEPITKQVCSGLQGIIPIAEFKNQLVVIVDNMKKRKLRGEISEAMILCGEDLASNVVQLCQPQTTGDMRLIGHQVVLEGYKQEDTITTRRIKDKEWADITSRLFIGDGNKVMYREEDTNDVKALLVIGNSPEDLIPLIVRSLPKGSQVR